MTMLLAPGPVFKQIFPRIYSQSRCTAVTPVQTVSWT